MPEFPDHSPHHMSWVVEDHLQGVCVCVGWGVFRIWMATGGWILVSHTPDSLAEVGALGSHSLARAPADVLGRKLGQSHSHFFRFGELRGHLSVPTFPEAFASMMHPSGSEGNNAFLEPVRVRPVPSLPEVTSCT